MSLELGTSRWAEKQSRFGISQQIDSSQRLCVRKSLSSHLFYPSFEFYMAYSSIQFHPGEKFELFIYQTKIKQVKTRLQVTVSLNPKLESCFADQVSSLKLSILEALGRFKGSCNVGVDARVFPHFSLRYMSCFMESYCRPINRTTLGCRSNIPYYHGYPSSL